MIFMRPFHFMNLVLLIPQFQRAGFLRNRCWIRSDFWMRLFFIRPKMSTIVSG